MNNSLKIISCALAIAALALPAGAAQKGSIKIAGSTTVLPLSQLWAEAYMDKNPDVSISVSGGGSGTGLSMLLNSSCDIANASRAAKPKEIDTARSRNAKLVGTKVAKDGLAMIVNKSSNVKNMTMDQIAEVYGGKISNWSRLGGDDEKIVVVGRDSSSGTYGSFQEMVLGGRSYRNDMLGQASNAAIAEVVSRTKTAIGYVGHAYAAKYAESGKVRILSVSEKTGAAGVMPTDANVISGKYPLSRYLYVYTLGKPSGVAGAFIKWCTGEEGQALVHRAGYVPVK